MSAVAVPQGKQSFFDPATGAPLAFGLVYLYVPFTTTPKVSWVDQAQAQANTQPIVLDAAGQCSIWGDGLYRQVCKRADGTQLWDVTTGFVDTGAGGTVVGPGLSQPGNVAVWGNATGTELSDGGQLRSLAFLDVCQDVNFAGQLQIPHGGTGAATAAAARTNLGLAIGANVQAYDAKLAAISGLAPTGDQVSYWTSSTTAALFSFSSFMRGVAGSADAATARTNLGAEPLGQVLGINTQTASYTLVLTDAGEVVELNSASAVNLTIPPNSSVAFPVKTRVDLVAIGAGQVTVVAGAGVTIRSNGSRLKLTGQYSAASLYKRATDEWVLIGDLSA